MKINITDLSLEDRPREKLEAKGPKALSQAELLAILIGSGTREENAVQLMQRILRDCHDSLRQLGRMSIEELCQYKGVGLAKAVTILAACELNSRIMDEAYAVERVTSSEDIFKYYRPKLGELPHEESHVLLLNQQLRIIGSQLIGRGGITGTVVDVRLILKKALLANATQIALCHNHPSGTLRPSREDDQLTDHLKKAAEVMNIRLIDHVIVTSAGYYSYSDESRL